MQRRDFFKTMIQFVGISALAPALLSKVASAEERRRGGGSPASGASAGPLSFPVVEPGKDAAIAMRYHHTKEEAQKDPQVMKAEKSGVPFDKQHCANYSFYTKAGKKKIKINGKDTEVEVGACTIFPQKLVAAEGICNSWAKKA